jgi:non-ribosomal peptide synthetase-like protein
VQPLWSTFVWRLEWVTGLYESPAIQVLVAMLTGTLFIAWLWRLFGVQVGCRVFADTIHVSEFDLVRIDDEAALNLNCGAQTHLFEDRVMKLGYIHIGPGCSIGSNSIVLYDTALGAGSKLGRLSLLMKGESLPAFTAWAGIPAQSDVWQAEDGCEIA